MNQMVSTSYEEAKNTWHKYSGNSQLSKRQRMRLIQMIAEWQMSCKLTGNDLSPSAMAAIGLLAGGNYMNAFTQIKLFDAI